jgi:hypothetical protein
MSPILEAFLSTLVLVLWLAPALLAVAFALNFAITRAFRLSLKPALAPPGVAGARRS